LKEKQAMEAATRDHVWREM